MLSRNTWLTTLKVAENDVTREGRNPDGVSSLSDALKVNRTLTHLDISENEIDEAKEREIQEKVSVNRAVNHTQQSFVEFLDSRYAPDEYDTNETGGYIINLELSREYLETEKRSRPPPRVRFDEPQPYKPWRDADGGDDWSLLEPEPMRRATRAKLKRARRLLEAHILAHKGFGFSAASALLALHRGLFAEAPAPAPGPAPAPAPSPAPAPAPPEAEAPLTASRVGTAAGDSRSEGNELNTRSVASLGLGPHASVDTFHTVMTDDPRVTAPMCLPASFSGGSGRTWQAPMTTAPGAIIKELHVMSPKTLPVAAICTLRALTLPSTVTLDQQIAIRVVDVRFERAARRDDHVAATRERAREVALDP